MNNAIFLADSPPRWHWPHQTDIMLAGILSVLTIAAAILYSQVNSGHQKLDATGVVLILLIAGAIALRRWPLPALFISLAALIPYHLMEYPPEVVLPAVMVLLYTVAVRGSLFRTVSIGFIVAVATLLTMRFSVNGWPGNEAIDAVGWLVATLTFGYAIKTHRAHAQALEERVARAEHAREQEALRRVAEERLNIARDLHDVIAHNIAVIGMQSSVAAYLIDQRRGHDDPELAELSKSLHQIADAGGNTLTELRAMLEMLRGGESDGRERDVVPGLERLPALIDSAQASGVAVEVSEAGERRALPASVDVAAYRIIQEALTNASKHAVATSATVSISYLPHYLEVQVTDNGEQIAATEIVPGLGLTGMNERVNLLGGSLWYGTCPDRAGFTVKATLPTRERTSDGRGEAGVRE